MRGGSRPRVPWPLRNTQVLFTLKRNKIFYSVSEYCVNITYLFFFSHFIFKIKIQNVCASHCVSKMSMLRIALAKCLR